MISIVSGGKGRKVELKRRGKGKETLRGKQERACYKGILKRCEKDLRRELRWADGSRTAADES